MVDLITFCCVLTNVIGPKKRETTVNQLMTKCTTCSRKLSVENCVFSMVFKVTVCYIYRNWLLLDIIDQQQKKAHLWEMACDICYHQNECHNTVYTIYSMYIITIMYILVNSVNCLYVFQLWARAPSCCHIPGQNPQGYSTGFLYRQHYSYR